MTQRYPRASHSFFPPWNSGLSVDTLASTLSTQGTARSTHSLEGFHPTIYRIHDPLD